MKNHFLMQSPLVNFG